MSTEKIYQQEAAAKAIAEHDAPLDVLIVQGYEAVSAQAGNWPGIDGAALANLKNNISRLKSSERRAHWAKQLAGIGVTKL